MTEVLIDYNLFTKSTPEDVSEAAGILWLHAMALYGPEMAFFRAVEALVRAANPGK